MSRTIADMVYSFLSHDATISYYPYGYEYSHKYADHQITK